MKRKWCLGLATAVLAAASLGVTGCDSDTQSSLIDLASSSTGGLVQIFVNDLLTDAANRHNPDLSAGLAGQEH